jgi:hypothetical protein
MRISFDTASVLQTFPPSMEGWREAPAPGEKQVQSYGLVASCLGMFLVGSLLHGAFVPSGLLPTLLLPVVTLLLHEFIHALSTPNWGLSTKTIIGLKKSKGLLMPYVYYDGGQSLWRFLWTGLAPTIFLTVLPIMVIKFVPLDASYHAGLGFVSLFNMGISGGDLVICIWLATHLDLRSSVRQNGWNLYWKAAM